MRRRLATAAVLLLAITTGCRQDSPAPSERTDTAAAPAAYDPQSVANGADGADAPTAVAPVQAPVQAPVATTTNEGRAFVPPDLDGIPHGDFGDLIRKGHAIFTDTKTHAPEFVGNGLWCSSCHLDAGRRADSAPLWGAWVRYPAYRAKTQGVDSFAERLRGCFTYSMDGSPPPLGHEVLAALEAYSFWMARGVPTGTTVPGAGYPKSEQAPALPDFERGAAVYAANCALCHGDDGQGQRAEGRYVFPPLWGPNSFNWGAGMHELDNAAAFIRANMPLGRGGMLEEQEAWDVAYFMNAHERPQDPRFTGDVAETRRRFHDDPMSLYGMVVNGHLLGSEPAQR